eukprot:13489-Rhodomonas_salina.2
MHVLNKHGHAVTCSDNNVGTVTTLGDRPSSVMSVSPGVFWRSVGTSATLSALTRTSPQLPRTSDHAVDSVTPPLPPGRRLPLQQARRQRHPWRVSRSHPPHLSRVS